MNRVAQGFDLDRNVYETILMAREYFNEDGTPKKKVKSDKRFGITGIPLEGGDLDIANNIPVIHAYIHVLKHLENAGFTFNARDAFEDPENPKQGMGTSKTKQEKEAVERSKLEFMNNAKGGCTL